jgi:hypothetical protein
MPFVSCERPEAELRRRKRTSMDTNLFAPCGCCLPLRGHRPLVRANVSGQQSRPVPQYQNAGGLGQFKNYSSRNKKRDPQKQSCHWAERVCETAEFGPRAQFAQEHRAKPIVVRLTGRKAEFYRQTICSGRPQFLCSERDHSWNCAYNFANSS